MRHTAKLVAEHLSVLLIAIVVWFAALLLDGVLRRELYAPIIPGQLALFALAFWMTLRTRNIVLAAVCATAWVGFGIYGFARNYDALSNSQFSHVIARNMLAAEIETALVMLAGGVAGIMWLRRGMAAPATS